MYKSQSGIYHGEYNVNILYIRFMNYFWLIKFVFGFSSLNVNEIVSPSLIPKYLLRLEI